MRSRYLVAMNAALALVSVGTASAEEANRNVLEGIVVSAERTDRSLRETASSVSVTSAQDIEQKGRIFVSVENLTDEVAPAFMFSGEVPEEDNAILLAPRTLLAGVEFEF